MSPELHEILSKTKRLDEDGVDQADSAKHANNITPEEETPLQQEPDGEIQLKQENLLKQGNEEEQPLQNNTDADGLKEVKTEDGTVSPAAEDNKKKEESEVKEEAEKQELIKEEKVEKASSPVVETQNEVSEEKKEEQKEETPPPPAPQE